MSIIEKKPKNPASVKEWCKEVSKTFHIPHSELALGDMITWESGSKLQMEHFLYLKALWTRHSADHFVLERYVDADVIETTRSYSKNTLLGQFCEGAVEITPANTQYSEKSIYSLVQLYMDLVRSIKTRREVGDDSTNKTWILRPTKQREERRLFASYATSPSTPSPAERKGKGKGKDKGKASNPLISTPGTHDTPKPVGYEPADKEFFADAQDESIVNMQLLLLLNALTERVPNIRVTGCHWTPERVAFKINDNRDPGLITDPKKQRLLKALVDGHLRHASGLSAALLEVKPYLRKGCEPKVQWQETAQMCASICEILRTDISRSDFGLLKSNIAGVKRRLMISQDHVEVYIIIAEYDREYEHYLEGTASTPEGSILQESSSASPMKKLLAKFRGHRKGTAAGIAVQTEGRSEGPTSNPEQSTRPTPEGTNGFLMMNSYGPWDITQREDLGNLCHVVIALSLYLSRFVFQESLADQLADLQI